MLGPHEVYEYVVPFNETTYIMKFFTRLYTTLIMTFLGIEACRRKHYDLLLAPVGEEFCMTIPAYITHLFTRIPWTAVVQNVPQAYPVLNSSGQLVVSLTKIYRYYRDLGIGILDAFLVASYSFFPKLLLPKIYNRAKAVISVSKSLGLYLKSLGTRCDIFVVGNGLYVDEIAKKKTPCGERYSGIFLGRFVPEKGIYDVLEIWRRVKKLFPKAILILVGHSDKVQMAALKNAINELEISENVKVLGSVYEEEKYALLKSSSLLLFPSKFESFGFVIAEAMACGLPVVCYDTPFARELFSCSAVLRAPIGDLRCAANFVCDLIRNEEKRRRLGEKALEFVKKYDWTKVIRKEAQTYRAVLNLWI